MGIFSKIFSNTRKPEGFWGRMMVAGFKDITIRWNESKHWLMVTAAE